MRNHTVVIGYGTTGQSATATLLRSGVAADRIVIIDPDSLAVGAANGHGLAAFEGTVPVSHTMLFSVFT